MSAIDKRFVYTPLEYRGARAMVCTGADLQNGLQLQAAAAQLGELQQRVKQSQKR